MVTRPGWIQGLPIPTLYKATTPITNASSYGDMNSDYELYTTLGGWSNSYSMEWTNTSIYSGGIGVVISTLSYAGN